MSDQVDNDPPMRHVPNNILAFNERVKPLMDQIMQICGELEIPLVASFQTHPQQLATATQFKEGQLVRKELVMVAQLLIDIDADATHVVPIGESGPLTDPSRSGEKSN